MNPFFKTEDGTIFVRTEHIKGKSFERAAYEPLSQWLKFNVPYMMVAIILLLASLLRLYEMII